MKILLLGTLDTKALEIGAVATYIESLGGEVMLLDTSGRAHPHQTDEQLADGRPLITREDVAAAAGTTASDVEQLPRGEAVAALRSGVARLATDLVSRDVVHGALCVGGAGAYVARDAFAALPMGFPKMVVSPLASGSRVFEPYVGIKDVATLHSVADIVGRNPVTDPVYRSAAGYIVGAARAAHVGATSDGTSGGAPAVAISMNGNTTEALMRAKAALEAVGRVVVAFHANGVGGRALEEFVSSGRAEAVLDYTTTELAGHEIGGLMDAGPTRMERAGELGLPQVLVPGCLDFITCGPAEDAAAEFPGRATFLHNPELTLVRLDTDEMRRMGRVFARKANRALGPTVVVVPQGGFSVQDAPGKAFWAPDSDAAFTEELRKHLSSRVPLHAVPYHINDSRFVEYVLDQLSRLLGSGADSTEDSTGTSSPTLAAGR